MKKALHILAAATLVMSPSAATADYSGEGKFDVGGQTPPTLGMSIGNCSPVRWPWTSWLPCWRF